jgi:N6-adenosine-specific RNA methylase IME4
MNAPLRAGHYRTIYADPPWNEQGGGKIKRGADRHYPLMRTPDICELPVDQWAAPDAHCYVWVTNNFLQDGLDVLHNWGFRYVTKIDWFKSDLANWTNETIEQTVEHIIGNYIGAGFTPLDATQAAGCITRTLLGMEIEPRDDASLQTGLGQYFRGVTESCLFGVRGKTEYRSLNGKRAQGRTGFHAPRGEHSAKPERMRQMIERVSHGPYLEMFARRAAPGWDLWGNQAPDQAVAKDGLPLTHGSSGITPAIDPNGERAEEKDPTGAA